MQQLNQEFVNKKIHFNSAVQGSPKVVKLAIAKPPKNITELRIYLALIFFLSTVCLFCMNFAIVNKSVFSIFGIGMVLGYLFLTLHKTEDLFLRK